MTTPDNAALKKKKLVMGLILSAIAAGLYLSIYYFIIKYGP